MSSSLTAEKLHSILSQRRSVTLIDVRREAARQESGLWIAGSRRERPEDVEHWGRGLAGPVVVYCVHGHEVSQNACTALRNMGVDAAYLEGGLEGWRAGGLPVEPTGEKR